jgi:ABC-type transport system involved in cytochrome c biogenesis permease component
MLTMFYLRIKALVWKEYIRTIRQYQNILGIFLFSILFSIVLSFLLRHLTIQVNELGIYLLPSFWIIFIASVFRYSLYSFKEEVAFNIFRIQSISGYKASEIFYVKIFWDILVISILLLLQFFVFYILLGFTDILEIYFRIFLGFLLSLPAVICISSIGAYMSHRSGNEEILMPILSLPLLLLISVSVVSYGEAVCLGNFDFYNSYWIKITGGISLILLSVSSLLFNAILSIKE